MDNSKKDDEFDQCYKPIILNPRDEKDLVKIKNIKDSGEVMVFDTFDQQLSELVKISHPSKKFTLEELGEKKAEYYHFSGLKPGLRGNWIYYPWRKTMVRILEEEDFIRLRTIRNRYKITDEEQRQLYSKTVGIIGLSVGQSVAISIAMERCVGELRIADFDTLDLSNMNRIRTGLYSLGIKKSWIVAREIAEMDPYLKVTLFSSGINDKNLNDFFNLNGKLDLLIEECDSLPIKILSRLKAKEAGIPVLMDTSDRGMIDIERFDIIPKRPIFHGFLKPFGEESHLLEILPEKGREIMMALLQYDNLSKRVKYSFSELGKSITSWPQLASSVFMGGAACCHYARMILLGQKVESGRYYIDLDEIINFYEG
ncbi:ThiF family adenylyltransferase [Negadavirga shengliensis]|uniref:ThiF family adenylyltransferase n=1 Tax=Negadavirga shengliensis TaxID=1389218 RepID=A0ABV9T4R5_9BACT